MNVEKPLWTCPKCNRVFVNKNQPHSCGNFSVANYLTNKSSHAVALFKCFEKAVGDLGEFQFAPSKNRIGFQVRMIFAAIIKMEEDHICGHLVLARKSDSLKFYKCEYISARNQVHFFKIFDSDFFDTEFSELLFESYQVGLQKHLTK